MKLYNAILENDKLREELPAILTELTVNPVVEQQSLKLKARVNPNSATSHALRILANLSERGNTAILSQLSGAALMYNISQPLEGIVIQEVISDRWSKHNWNSTFDFILAIPEISKVIAVSTTEAEIQPDIPRLAKVRLENAHLYTFFNRAHAVKGRRVTSAEYSGKILDANEFKPFMRTCSDIEAIAKGETLGFFTPFATNDGLRLGFFFTLVCKVNSVETVRSPSGAGVTFDQVSLVLYDFSGCLRIRLSTEVFRESMENPIQRSRVQFNDPLDLEHSTAPVLVIGVWILGQEYPDVLFLGVPELDKGIEIWEALAFMNSHRKLPYSTLLTITTKEAVEQACKQSNNLLKINEWIYFLEDGWPKEIFLSMEKNNFPNFLKLADALAFGASYQEYKVWSERILRFLRLNPHLLSLYRSKIPVILRSSTQINEKNQIPKTVEELKNDKIVPLKQKSKDICRVIGSKCPVCGMKTIVKDISPSDGYYVEYCKGGILSITLDGKTTKVNCTHWGAGWS